MTTRQQQLQDLVQSRIDLQWSAFAAGHPHLARAIERTVLVEQVIERLADDPAFTDAMARAAVDRQTTHAADRAIRFIDVWVRRVLGL